MPPREDQWYKAPTGFKTARPGTILRLRPAPGDLTSIIDSRTVADNILFCTTDSHYQPSWAVTTLLVPKTTDAHALLSYQLPYNSADVNASPSHLLHAVKDDFWPTVIETVQTALSRGWYVNIPDFEGPLAAFGDGLTAGHATLDSIRGALDAGFGMDKARTRVGLWGFSGGALASGWATELQAHYAPELNFAGAALGALPPDAMCIAKLSGTRWAGLVPQFLLGTTAQFPSAYEYLLSQLKATHRTAFLATHHYDIVKAFESFADQDIFEYISNGREILQHPLIRNILARRTCMGYHGVPQMPLFIYKAIADEITPIEDTAAHVEKWSYVCVNILYERNTMGDHLAESVNGKARALEWLCIVLDGTYSHEGCTVKDVAVSISV